jgi:hypothetical protein
LRGQDSNLRLELMRLAGYRFPTAPPTWRPAPLSTPGIPEGRRRRNARQPNCRSLLSAPLACSSTLDHRRAEAAGVLRGGALEPESRCCHKKGRLAPTAHNSVNGRTESLSLLGGASIWTSAFQAEHHLDRSSYCLRKHRRRPSGRPRNKPLCRSAASGRTSRGRLWRQVAASALRAQTTAATSHRSAARHSTQRRWRISAWSYVGERG